jgi:hypothetical protein
MRKKNAIIRKHTRLLIATKADMEELESWSESEYGFIAGCISFSPTSMCPWCIKERKKYTEPCSECGYGKRHGKCIDIGSRWKMIIHRLAQKNLTTMDVPELRYLVLRTKEKVRLTKEGEQA